MKNLKLKTKNGKLEEKTLLVLPDKLENIILAGRNLKNLTITFASLLNTYEVLNQEKIIFMKSSIKVLEKVFVKKPSK
jgi:large subunit ribosomal protein L4